MEKKEKILFTWECEFSKDGATGVVLFKYGKGAELEAVFFIPCHEWEVQEWIITHGEEDVDYGYEAEYYDMEGGNGQFESVPILRQEELPKNYHLFAMANQDRWVQGS